MEIIKSKIFSRFHEIIFGIHTRYGFNRGEPFFFNTSLTVGDDENNVWENREKFLNELGLRRDQTAFQRQIHSDIIKIVDSPGIIGESDGMVTNKKMLGITVSTADCTPIFLYDRGNKVIATVHSGWRGTEKRILDKAIMILTGEFNSKPADIYAFIGPCVSKRNYEVGEDVALLFSGRYYSVRENGKFLLDVREINKDILLQSGIPSENIEVSGLCSFENDNLHSYRRDGEKSGRAIGVIAMKGE